VPNSTKYNIFDCDPLASLCENMTSSTKPKVHNLLLLDRTRLQQQ